MVGSLKDTHSTKPTKHQEVVLETKIKILLPLYSTLCLYSRDQEPMKMHASVHFHGVLSGQISICFQDTKERLCIIVHVHGHNVRAMKPNQGGNVDVHKLAEYY